MYSCHPHGTPGLSSWFLASAQLSLAITGIWEVSKCPVQNVVISYERDLPSMLIRVDVIQPHHKIQLTDCQIIRICDLDKGLLEPHMVGT